MQDRHFLDCVASGARPLTDGRNGLAVVEALEAAELSRRLGRPVLLEELQAERRSKVPAQRAGQRSSLRLMTAVPSTQPTSYSDAR